MTQGRVFARRNAYALLPPRLKMTCQSFSEFAVRHAKTVFPRAKWRDFRAVGPCVKGEFLLRSIETFLSQETYENIAMQVAQALILSCIIAPVKDNVVIPEFLDSEIYELTDKSYSAHSVYAVGKYASRADFGYYVEKSRVMTAITCGIVQERERSCYFVLSREQKLLYVFASDVAKKSEHEIALGNLVGIAYAENLRYGMSIRYGNVRLDLELDSKQLQNAWILALLGCECLFSEFRVIPKSLDVIEDTYADGRAMRLETYKNRVLLIVNIASKDSHAPKQLLALSSLYSEFHAQGLEILAFPSDQLEGNEFGDAMETQRYCRQVYGAKFPIMSIQDLNGPAGRPLFLYLNHYCPGPFGNFTEENYTKFLLSCKGEPRARYSGRDDPLGLTHAISQLLDERNRLLLSA